MKPRRGLQLLEAYVAPISKRRKKDSLGTTGWPVSITSVIAFCDKMTRSLANCSHSILILVTAGVPQEHILEHTLVFVSDLEEKMHCTVFNSADDIETGNAADKLEGRRLAGTS